MGLVYPELSLALKPSYNPEMINGFLRQFSNSMITDQSENIDEFVKRLENELMKIQVFKRELPLCMLLLKDAIVYLKHEITQHKTSNAHQPILKEFIPLKRESSCGENAQMNKTNDEESSRREMKSWMSSVKLSMDDLPTWSSVSHTSSNQRQDLVSEDQKGDEKSNQIVGGNLYDPCKAKAILKGFEPFDRSNPAKTCPDVRKKVDKEDAGVPGITLLVPGVITHPEEESISRVLNCKLGGNWVSNSSSHASNGRPSYQQASSRKQRRSWAPELHRRFVEALTRLGGAQVATPKLIRKLMKVDGLTNDEVKSHLQKYRLHSKRVSNDSGNKNGHSSSGSWPDQDQVTRSLPLLRGLSNFQALQLGPQPPEVIVWKTKVMRNPKAIAGKVIIADQKRMMYRNMDMSY